MKALTLERLQKAITGEYSAIRRVTRLSPAGDPKIFPPTYEGGTYAEERRKVVNENGQLVELSTILLDSVQSAANRMEQALLRAYDRGDIRFPLVQIDFAAGESDAILSDIGRITALDVPHRITDALFRDSEFDGKPFRTSKGSSLDQARTTNATPVFELCPTALIFGFWDSTGPRGGLGAKVPRAVVSEIVAYDIATGKRPASRIDPVVNEGVDIFARRGGGWTADETLAEKDGKGNPVKYRKEGKASEINLGNVTPSLTHKDDRTKQQVPNHGGITMAYAEQTVVLSLAALRRLRFPVQNANSDQTTIDDAARTVLAALALAAVCSLDREGFDLRSRCLLDGKPGTFQFVGRGETDDFDLQAPDAYALLKAAAARAVELGLPWPLEPVTLTPSADLRLLVRKSRQKSMAAAGGE
ncbi:MAG TPA: type I-U CRISPR-associated RAMP protein Csb1/Cas7u [Bryobacteraceae bacterium]|nr:type I-U CRISPR-associated RAMP protein Csb1/Cas7u [Bryobacteraceae bacterium]